MLLLLSSAGPRIRESRIAQKLVIRERLEEGDKIGTLPAGQHETANGRTLVGVVATHAILFSLIALLSEPNDLEAFQHQ